MLSIKEINKNIKEINSRIDIKNIDEVCLLYACAGITEYKIITTKDFYTNIFESFAALGEE